ncbi:MAG: (Fe-S)-binding protein, partial [Angelakisella sp.]
GLDCGSCGAPSCRALAEDVVRGYSNEEACIYVLKEKLEIVMESMMTLSQGGRPRAEEEQE